MKKVIFICICICATSLYYWYENRKVSFGQETLDHHAKISISRGVFDASDEASESKEEKKSNEIGIVISETEIIEKLPTEELTKRLFLAKKKIADQDLINRLNAEKLSKVELEEAKLLLESVALMSIEQAARNLKEFEPTLESGLEHIGVELTEIRNLLRK